MKKGAEISECGKYRFKLWRIWDESKPLVLWIMHNPSTADAESDDPTIRRIINFSKGFGFGGLYVGNLFPFRATDPKEISKNAGIASTENNWQHIRDMANICELKILAYGNPIMAYPKVYDMGYEWHCLKKTNKGNPCHPLYLKSDLMPKLFTEKGVVL